MERRSLMQDAWERSIPVTANGLSVSYGVEAGPGALRDIALYDDRITLRYDLQRQVVTVWRYWVSGQPVIQFDNPLGKVVDNRLVGVLAEADNRKMLADKGNIEARVKALDEENARIEKEIFEHKWGKIDHGRYAHAFRRARAELHGDPAPAPSAVPVQLTSSPEVQPAC